MSQSPERIFVYRPPDSQHQPDPGEKEHWSDEQPRDLTVWLFSPVGAIIVWLMAIGFILPAGLITLLILPEDYGILTAGFGLWLMLGLAVIHWWIPPGDERRKHSEGLAVAGWHVLVTAVTTGFFAWLLLFPDGRRPVFTAADVFPVIVVGGILLTMFGTILTLLRGHLPGRSVRYAWTMLCMLAVWMAWWLVAVHGGL